MRALIVIRLSRVTDATTSPERQLAECRKLCEQRGYEVVGIAEDLDVSGSVDPFNRKHRPRLARWLAGEHEAFDVIVVYRVDRLTRSIRHLQGLVAWAEDRDKLIVSATESHFDMTTPFAAVVIALMGTVAQMELEAISERNASAARHNIKAGRWRGGVPPWGYLPDDKSGEWRLAQDKQQVDIINEVVRRVLGQQEPLQRIANDLTDRGVLTPKDRFAEARGREVKGYGWSQNQLKRSLISEAMLGYAVSKGQVVRNDDGSPVVRSAPILSRSDFEALRVELSGRSTRGEPTARSTSLLLRVISCGVCHQPAYRFNGGSHSKFPRYRCSSIQKNNSCGNKTIRVDYAENTVETLLLTLLGDSERLERVWDSGSDNSAELTTVNDELTDLAGLIGTPAFRSGTPQWEQVSARIDALVRRQDELSAEATKPAGWVWQPTGELFRDWWNRQDVEGRNIWLRSMGVRLEFNRDKLNLDFGDLQSLTEHLAPAGPVVRWKELFASFGEHGIEGIEIEDDRVIVHHLDGRLSTLDRERKEPQESTSSA